MLNSFLFIRVFTVIVVLLWGSCSFAAESGWPRQIKDSNRGITLLQHAPQRIVSTSVTLTGSLLAIGAPVIASGATTPGSWIADDQGFFRQWGEIARQHHVKRLYTIGHPNVESIVQQKPDLILVSATGGDSTLDLYDQLSAIAPTIVVNYDNKSWQQLLTELGTMTGHEAQAARCIAEFNQQLKAVKSRIKLPPQPVNALVYRTATGTANLLTKDSAQGKFLQQLGFTLAMPSAAFNSGNNRNRQDILKLEGENLVIGLNGNSFLLFANNDHTAEALMQNPLLAHLPAIKNKQVWALGNETFRLDYYSAMLLLNRIDMLFNK